MSTQWRTVQRKNAPDYWIECREDFDEVVMRLVRPIPNEENLAQYDVLRIRIDPMSGDVNGVITEAIKTLLRHADLTP